MTAKCYTKYIYRARKTAFSWLGCLHLADTIGKRTYFTDAWTNPKAQNKNPISALKCDRIHDHALYEDSVFKYFIKRNNY